MSCPSTRSLNPQTYANACVLAASSPSDVKTVFTNCCNNATAPVTTTSCYVSCNSTSIDVEVCFGFGVQTLPESVTINDEDFACYISNSSSSSSSPSSTSASSGSATAGPTSVKPSGTVSPSSTGTSSKTSPSGSSSASPSSTVKPSKAAAGGSLSLGSVVVVGLAVFGLLL